MTDHMSASQNILELLNAMIHDTYDMNNHAIHDIEMLINTLIFDGSMVHNFIKINELVIKLVKEGVISRMKHKVHMLVKHSRYCLLRSKRDASVQLGVGVLVNEDIGNSIKLLKECHDMNENKVHILVKHS